MAPPQEMTMNANAPPVSPPSKALLPTATFAVPKARPGPNAFALKDKADADALENHRLNSNAFYHQEFVRRHATPPTAIHPAYRNDPFQVSPSAYAAHSLQPSHRVYQGNTGTRFVSAGTTWTPEVKPETPKLVPDGVENAVPTTRGWIEERSEQNAWHDHHGVGERTPVFVYSPKAQQGVTHTSSGKTSDSRSAADGSTPHVTDQRRSKSPRKNLLGRLGISSFRSSTLTSQPPTPSAVVETQRPVPPKAAAVLGTSNSHSPSRKSFGLSRSSSKKDVTVAARTSASTDNGGGAAGTRPGTSTTTGNSTTPATFLDAWSPFRRETNVTDTPSKSSKAKPRTKVGKSGSNRSSSPRRIISYPMPIPDTGAPEQANAAALTRSESLHYHDQSVPPTPPSKDTPPQRKPVPVRGELSADTPKEERTSIAIKSTSLSPSKAAQSVSAWDGSDHKVTDVLRMGRVTSMRATVVKAGDGADDCDYQYDHLLTQQQQRQQQNHEAECDCESLSERVSGTGLLAGGHLPQTMYTPSKQQVYSPSLYAAEENWSCRSRALLAERVSPVTALHVSPQLSDYSASPSTVASAKATCNAANSVMSQDSYGSNGTNVTSGTIPVVLQLKHQAPATSSLPFPPTYPSISPPSPGIVPVNTVSSSTSKGGRSRSGSPSPKKVTFSPDTVPDKAVPEQQQQERTHYSTIGHDCGGNPFLHSSVQGKDADLHPRSITFAYDNATASTAATPKADLRRTSDLTDGSCSSVSTGIVEYYSPTADSKPVPSPTPNATAIAAEAQQTSPESAASTSQPQFRFSEFGSQSAVPSPLHVYQETRSLPDPTDATASVEAALHLRTNVETNAAVMARLDELDRDVQALWVGQDKMGNDVGFASRKIDGLGEESKGCSDGIDSLNGQMMEVCDEVDDLHDRVAGLCLLMGQMGNKMEVMEEKVEWVSVKTAGTKEQLETASEKAGMAVKGADAAAIMVKEMVKRVDMLGVDVLKIRISTTPHTLALQELSTTITQMQKQLDTLDTKVGAGAGLWKHASLEEPNSAGPRPALWKGLAGGRRGLRRVSGAKD